MQLDQAVLVSLPFYIHDVIRVAAQIIDTEIRAILLGLIIVQLYNVAGYVYT